MSCKSLEKSGLGEKEIDLYNQLTCTSCEHNQLGEFECKECDDILFKNATRHIPDWKSHILTLWFQFKYVVHEGKNPYKCKICVQNI